MATTLEQFLIEDQLFCCDANETVDEKVNESGDGSIEANRNYTNCNASENIENFEQQQEDGVQSDDTSSSSNMDKNQVVDDERPNTSKINDSYKNVNATYNSKYQVSHASKLHCYTKPRKYHVNHSRHRGVCRKPSIAVRNFSRLQNPEIIDVDLVVHGVNDKILNDVERGTTSISLHSLKRCGIDTSGIENPKKKHRTNLDAAEYFVSEIDDFPLSYKSHAVRPRTHRT